MNKCATCDASAAPAAVLFEDEDLIAYLAEDAATMSHIIVTTKRHFPSIFETPDYLVAWAFAISNKLSKVLIESLNMQGINTLIHTGKGSDHFAINLIPRFENDSLKLVWTPNKGDTDELKKIQDKLISASAGKWVFETKGKVQEAKKEKADVLREVPGEDNYLIKHLHRLP